MRKLVTSLVVSSFLCAFVVQAESEEEEVYSTEAYCLLSHAGAESNYLRAYARKLGFTPSNSVCNSFRQISEESTPKAWDFSGGRPYPGSAIRLSARQIEIIKASRKEN